MSDADYEFGVFISGIDLDADAAADISSALTDAVYPVLADAGHDLDGVEVEASTPKIEGRQTASFSVVASAESGDE